MFEKIFDILMIFFINYEYYNFSASVYLYVYSALLVI